jgi:quinol monooxygenase YgiN
MIERYQDQESLKLHGSSKPFTEFQKKLKELGKQIDGQQGNSNHVVAT